VISAPFPLHPHSGYHFIVTLLTSAHVLRFGKAYFLSLSQINIQKPNHVSETECHKKETLPFSITVGKIKCINCSRKKRMREECGMVQMQKEVRSEKSRRKRSGRNAGKEKYTCMKSQKGIPNTQESFLNCS
jgi:hypothetical protein